MAAGHGADQACGHPQSKGACCRPFAVSPKNRGTPIETLIYYSPSYGDPQKGTAKFGKPPYHLGSLVVPCLRAIRYAAFAGEETAYVAEGKCTEYWQSPTDLPVSFVIRE